MPKGELHIELVVDYADGSLGDVSRGARLLYVDALCKAKFTLNDGTFTRPQLDRLAHPENKRTVTKYLEELTSPPADRRDPPLTLNPDGTYTISVWLRRNPSAAQVAAKMEEKAAEKTAAARRANHERWHVRRGTTDPNCPLCGSGADTPPDPHRIRPGSVRIPTETETETETSRDTYQHRVENRHANDQEPAGPPGRAEALLAEHIAAVGRVNPRAVAEFGGHLAELCRAGYDDDTIRAGFVLWRSRCVRPSALPDMVDLAARGGGRAAAPTHDDEAPATRLLRRMAAGETTTVVPIRPELETR